MTDHTKAWLQGLVRTALRPCHAHHGGVMSTENERGADVVERWRYMAVWMKGNHWYIANFADGEDGIGPFDSEADATTALNALRATSAGGEVEEALVELEVDLRAGAEMGGITTEGATIFADCVKLARATLRARREPSEEAGRTCRCGKGASEHFADPEPDDPNPCQGFDPRRAPHPRKA